MSNDVPTEPSTTDFDFWMGRWKVHNRRLRKRLADSDEWDEFEATSVARPILDGMGNEDEFRTDYDGGVRHVLWRHRRLRGPDVFEGRPILVRFTWSGVTTPTPRWEQAFSDDGGETWETNWIMEFTRANED